MICRFCLLASFDLLTPPPEVFSLVPPLGLGIFDLSDVDITAVEGPRAQIDSRKMNESAFCFRSQHSSDTIAARCTWEMRIRKSAPDMSPGSVILQGGAPLVSRAVMAANSRLTAIQILNSVQRFIF